ncbi:hypothetical protein U978_01546 [Staphylococcus aureus 1110601704]|nr:hypothetical protein U978_01546 [Staphylococcus aureus 1110601704]
MLKINLKYQLKNTLIRINIDDTEPKIYGSMSNRTDES